MNRQEWEEQVFNSDLNPTARVVCIAIGSHGNWTDDREIRPSKTRLSGMTGLSREYTGKYVDALEEQGWLKHTGTTSNKVKVYELSTPTGPAEGILSIKSRGSSKKLKNQVVVDYDNLEDSQEEQVVVDTESGCRSYRPQVVVDTDEVVVDYDTNLKNLQEEPTKEPTISTSANATVPLDENESLGEVAMFNRVEQVDSYIQGTRYLSLTSEQKKQIRELTLNPQWYGTESRPNYRTQAAIKEVLG